MRFQYRFFFVITLIAALFLWSLILRQNKINLPISNLAEEKEEHSGAIEALDFWSRSRAYPENDIPKDKYFKATQYARKYIKKFSRGTSSLNQWEFMGPINLSGRTISLAI